jgi:DNA-binding MurR/RpiR family transcriptional regulator
MKEAVSSRIAQLALLDSLCIYLALQKYENTIDNIDQMTNILNEMRYQI